MQFFKHEMNFLHINASDIKWGASVAGFRFHKALMDKGYGSHILCGLKKMPGNDSTSIVPGRYGWVFNVLAGNSFNYLGLQSFGYPSAFFIKFSKWIRDWADIVILRNLQVWYFSIGVLPWIAQKAPIIWRLTDMWALTGHCSYSYDCDRWKIGCGECLYLSEFPPLLFDTTHFLWQRKKRLYERLKGRLVFVSPSKWLQTKVMESPLTKDFRCEYIPTAVDLNVFKPTLQQEARNVLGIQQDEKVIMFSSFKLTDKRKGIHNLLKVISEFKKRVKSLVTLLLVGYGAEKLEFPNDVKVVKIALTGDDKLLANCYNACDIYVSLSKADNLPNTLVEASACGVPIVTLDSGGCREVVNAGESGYVVRDNKEAIAALRDILENKSKKEQFSKNARKIAESRFSMDLQVERYGGLAKVLILRK